MAKTRLIPAGMQRLRLCFLISIAAAPLLALPVVAGTLDEESARSAPSTNALFPPMLSHEVERAAFDRLIASLYSLDIPELMPLPVELADAKPNIADDPVYTSALPSRSPHGPDVLFQPMPPMIAIALPLNQSGGVIGADIPDDERVAALPTLRPSIPSISAADLGLVRPALAEYKKGNLAGGDAFKAKVEDEAARLALEWAAIRNGRQQAGFRRLATFAVSNADFPMVDWVYRRAEEALYVEKHSQLVVLDFFATRAPEMAHGKVALARALKAQGQEARAAELVRDAWRENRSSASLRTAILKEFSGAIGPGDHRYLAERLIYEGETTEGLRIAQGAGAAALAAMQVLASSINENGGAPALIARLDAAQLNDPAVLFSRIQALRRSDKIAEAGQLMLRAPTTHAAVVDGDEWWLERRMLSRKLLDAGDSKTAYKIAAAHNAESSAHRVDAETHAGWLALRFLDNPDLAAAHFTNARSAAITPPSIARAAYWQGRAAEALQDPMRDVFYLGAGGHKHTYYGQLALARLGISQMPDMAPAPDMNAQETATRTPGLRAIRVLLEAEAKDLAQPLIADAAQKSATPEAALALGDLTARFGLPRLTLMAGKFAMQRGLKVEEHAFPTFGIPRFETSATSAEAAIVYSIARQESEFDPKVVSHAGARGLMQLMPATARRTASRSRLPFDVNRLTADPAFNAQIGAAHLGELFGEYSGSYVLSFAAYNAGGGRVKEWTTAYGDPRNPGVDVVDWIERIPITETRHYVQKILENLQIYRTRLTADRTLGIAADMQRGARKTKVAALISTP